MPVAIRPIFGDYGLPRRFAPRNDKQITDGCHSTNCRKAVGSAAVSGFSQRKRSGMAPHCR